MTFLADVGSIVYIILFAVSGWFISRLLFPRDRLVRRLLFGMTAGLVMLMWLPVLLAFIFGFTFAMQLIALAIACGLGALSIFLYNKKLKNDPVFETAVKNRKRFSLKEERALLLTCVPLVLVGVILLSNHTIVSASDGSLHVGQCTYGDLCMHLGFISSIAVQKTFPPMYSILPGTPLGYPFLCDSVSSTFYSLGSSLRMAALLPAIYAYIVVVLGVYLFFEQWFKRSSVASIATWLFFIGGGFGFAYFFDNAKTYASLTSGSAWSGWLSDTYQINAEVLNPNAPDMMQQLMNGFYKTPTNFVSLGLRWVNSIADMLVPQRATLFGWALLFPALQLLHRAAFEDEKRLFIYLGVLAGAMPLVHTHSFFALGLISAFLIVALAIRKLAVKKGDRQTLKYFLLFGLIAAALAAPQLIGFTFRQSSAGGFLKLHWNWCNESDSWLWFYIKNLGLIFILMPIAFLYTKPENKLFYGGGLLIWAVCEFVVFQPNTYDNNKLLFVWFALTCGIVAELIMTLYDRIADGGAGSRRTNERVKAAVPLSRRIAQRMIFVILIGVMLISGVMTLAREYVSADHVGIQDGRIKYKETGYEVVSAQLVDLCEYIKANAEPDAVILTATNHNNAVAMLTGRNIVCGADNFLYFHGVDYQTRYYNVKQMYEQPAECFERFAEEYDVDYVLISSWERGRYSVDSSYFTRFEKVYDMGGVTLYKVGD